LESAPTDPRPRQSEIQFLLTEIAPYLARKPQRSDIRAVFAGIRPLVRASHANRTAKLSRDHVVEVSSAGLVSIMGGKWTTYRKMAEDCVNLTVRIANLPSRACATTMMTIHGGNVSPSNGAFAEYGSDGPALAELISTNPAWSQPLDPRLPYLAGQVIWATRFELARTIEDVLARRVRALFIDAEVASSVAPRVAELLAFELGRDAAWQADQIGKFQPTLQAYRPSSAQ
jgi:glycerol-3-phosphate dehydrogenase